MKLDENGRCCGRKPHHYKGGAWNSPPKPVKCCFRCNRDYDPDSGEQVENCMWEKNPNTGEFREVEMIVRPLGKKEPEWSPATGRLTGGPAL